MCDKKYNGWTNWETWVVNLWFGDSLQSYIEEDRIEDPDSLKNYVQEFATYADKVELAGFLSDVFNGFMSEVNWMELLNHYKDV